MALDNTFKKTPLLMCPEPVSGRTLWVKDESKCPTGTFKDRLGWALAKQIEQSSRERLLITCITLGNTLISVSHYRDLLPTESRKPRVLGLFPLGFSGRKIGPDTSGNVCSGGDLIKRCEREGVFAKEVDLDTSFLNEVDIKELAGSLAPEFDHHRDISYGIGEAAYAPILTEALSELKTPPAIILVPVGSGVLFDEFIDVIELYGLPSVVIGVSVIDKTSIADKIYGYYSPFYKELRRKGRATRSQYPRHPVIVVKDDAIRHALTWASSQGYDAEPSSAAALVPLLKNLDWLPKGDVLWINTGNGVVRT
jgi:hypothetical protein